MYKCNHTGPKSKSYDVEFSERRFFIPLSLNSPPHHDLSDVLGQVCGFSWVFVGGNKPGEYLPLLILIYLSLNSTPQTLEREHEIVAARRDRRSQALLSPLRDTVDSLSGAEVLCA
jgi:hypothetical protein